MSKKKKQKQNGYKISNPEVREIVSQYIAIRDNVEANQVTPLRLQSDGLIAYNDCDGHTQHLRKIPENIRQLIIASDPSEEIKLSAIGVLLTYTEEIDLEKLKESLLGMYPVIRDIHVSRIHNNIKIKFVHGRKEKVSFEKNIKLPVPSASSVKNGTAAEYMLQGIIEHLGTLDIMGQLRAASYDALYTRTREASRDQAVSKLMDEIAKYYSINKYSYNSVEAETPFGTVDISINLPYDWNDMIRSMISSNAGESFSVQDKKIDDQINQFVEKRTKQIAKAKEEVYPISKNVKRAIKNALDVERMESIKNYIHDGLLNKPTRRVYDIKMKYDPVTNTGTAKTMYGTVVLDEHLQAVSIEYSDYYRELIAFMENGEYTACRNFYFETVQELHLESIKRKNGPGLLFGNTDLQIEYRRYTKNIHFSGPSYEENPEEWRNEIYKLLRNVVDPIDAKYKVIEASGYEKWGRYINSFLAKDIAKVVIANSKYITENSLVAIIRGVGLQSNIQFKTSAARGKYYYVSPEEVKRMMNNMIREGLLATESSDGRYGYFEVIHPAPETYCFAKMQSASARSIEELIADVKRGAILNDIDAEALFRECEKYDDPEHQMMVIDLMKNTSFGSLYLERIIMYLSLADQAIFDYLKILEDGSEKSYWCKLIREVRLNASKKQKASRNQH